MFAVPVSFPQRPSKCQCFNCIDFFHYFSAVHFFSGHFHQSPFSVTKNGYYNVFQKQNCFLGDLGNKIRIYYFEKHLFFHLISEHYSLSSYFKNLDYFVVLPLKWILNHQSNFRDNHQMYSHK